jgi:type II restriction/modification system DNA methylase subunit YeeA
MNKNNLKSYAPQARRDFMRAVSDRAALLGLSPDVPARVEVSGDVVIINGQAHPRSVAVLRERLLERIKQEGWEQFVEEIAYTWFNRFTALRFMELNGFLPHGLRVLSNPDESKDEPEILEKAHTVELPGLARERVVELKLAANKETALYRLLLVAQCNQLNAAMPFLFERINDETELLLPDNLLHSDSVIRKLVGEIEEEDWRQVEIIGWLYQFYISERKDEVIGSVVKSEDIPAATQLFTPNWIVKYMTQNSLGRMWLQTYPDSGLRAKMEYYIEPAEQSEEVKRELASRTPTSINPEEIKILDPACGSGHILVEAYDLLKEIYRERGYSSRDIPRLILEKNLYGLDIDERAAQLASFALLMKARADERRVLGENAPRLNIVAIPESSHLNAEDLAAALVTKREPKRAMPIRDDAALFADARSQPSLSMVVAEETEVNNDNEEVTRHEVVKLLELFEQGKTIGSLIEIPAEMRPAIAPLESVVSSKLASQELMERMAAEQIAPFEKAAKILAQTYDCVIANPPYMGSKGMNAALKQFSARRFPQSKSDLFAMFIERGFEMSKREGLNAMVTMQSWMFLASFEALRLRLLETKTIATMAHLGARAFSEISGEVVQTTSFVMHNRHLGGYKPAFFRLVDGSEEEKRAALIRRENRYDQTRQDDFHTIPGSPIAYWVSDSFRKTFDGATLLEEIATPQVGITSSDNQRFLRQWFEIDRDKIGIGFESSREAQASGLKWFPYNKGGNFRKWYGNNEYVINWWNDGEEVKFAVENNPRDPRTTHWSRRIFNVESYFQESISWTLVSSSNFGARHSDKGFLFDVGGSSAFPPAEMKKFVLGLLCTKLAFSYLKIVNPTINFQSGNIGAIPVIKGSFALIGAKIDLIVDESISLSREDWDSFETSWDFQTCPLLRGDLKATTVAESFANWEHHSNENIKRMQELETENNRLFIETYGLQDEFSPEVPEEQITLARADASADTRRLVSYAVGCMMGRYSLDEPGLIYANSGGEGFDPSRYQTFPADADGIIPVTDLEWFDDDAANRFSEFVRRAWGDDTYTQNLTWIAAQLGAKSGEIPVEAIRRYFSTQFFKDHMQTYKKRPIYWLFSSGKQKAFECLVYLHRYNESTLSRMRNEYVTPLMGKLSARIEHATKERDDATTGSAKNKLQKQLDVLLKKQHELAAFDEQLRHYADQRIHIDLDDGVRANYGKFGTLLAEVKTIAAASE